MRLPRERRIRASADFARIRNTGSRLDCGPFLLNFKKGEGVAPARFAVIAAKMQTRRIYGQRHIEVVIDDQRHAARRTQGLQCAGLGEPQLRIGSLVAVLHDTATACDCGSYAIQQIVGISEIRRDRVQTCDL